MEEVALVRAELVRQQLDARKTIHRGVVLIALIPLVVAASIMGALALGGIGALFAILSGSAYAVIGSIAGIATIASGAVEHRRVRKQLHDYDHVRQLPEARVVVRKT